MNEMIFDWIPFYTELANILLDYRDHRPELIEKIKSVFQSAKISMPKIEQDDQVDDLDPFTVFGFFNKSMKESNRLKIVKAIGSAFHVKAPVPTSFDSLPVLNPLNANFFPFREYRSDGQIETLWDLFVNALAYAKEQKPDIRDAFKDALDRALAIKGNGTGKITMGLYWIAPETYLNLDSRNRWYIYESGQFPQAFVSSLPKFDGRIPSEQYLEIIEKTKAFLKEESSTIKTFSALSYEAWQYSESVNVKLKEAQLTHDTDETAYWLYTVFNEESWEDCQKNGIFVIGIDDIGDLNQYKTKEEIRQALIKTYGGKSTRVMQALMGMSIAHYMKPGDVIFAKRKNTLVGKGIITGEYYFDDSRPMQKNVRKVNWEITGNWEYAGNLEAKRLTDITSSPKLIKSIINTLNGFQTIDHDGENDTSDALGDSDVKTRRYWMYSPGQYASKWDEFYASGIMAIGWPEIGDLSAYETKQDIKNRMRAIYDPDMSYKNDALATWQFAREMQTGDIVYAKRGIYQLIGRGIVISDYYYDSSEPEYPNRRKIKWTHKGEWAHPGKVVQKTLTDITPYTDYVEKLEAIFAEGEEEENEKEPQPEYPPYDEEQFLSEVYMDNESYKTLEGLVRIKKNVILQGAPGVGKTFVAKRLAYSMMGEKNQDRIMLVQFHQSYSYEDFIEGFRPAGTGGGFEIKKGAFYHFCRKAADDPENEYFFIIDEINRGNLSKIFGELFMLIENDKRGNALQLLYSDEKFFVPKNVYIIGMMNTADRSLAMLDYALRRRFAFFDMRPGFDTAGFRDYRKELASEKFDRLIACVKSLNETIAEDESLGEGFCIGHSYFCNLKDANDASLRAIVEYELAPLIKEYWYDDRTKAAEWISRLKEAIK